MSYFGILLMQGAIMRGAALLTSSLTFAPQAPGVNSTAQNVTLTNSGSAPLVISGISFGGTNGGDFSQTNNCGSAVPANSSCQISITFTPLAGGNRNATLLIANNGVGGTQTVDLAGTGEDFSLTGSPLSSTVTPGQAANYVITAGTNGRFQSNNCIYLQRESAWFGVHRNTQLNYARFGASNATVDLAVATTSSSAGMFRPVQETLEPAPDRVCG